MLLEDSSCNGLRSMLKSFDHYILREGGEMWGLNVVQCYTASMLIFDELLLLFVGVDSSGMLYRARFSA